MRERTDVAEARRTAVRVAKRAGFSEEDAARVALAVTEGGTNIIKHAAEGGEILVQPARVAADTTVIDVLALDRGAGIADVGASLRDGVSTAGSAGTGLGAMMRVSDVFDIMSTATGTAVLARCCPGRRCIKSGRFQVGAVSVPYPGLEVSGDDWTWGETGGGTMIAVVDGLGHGEGAAAAAQVAIEAIERRVGAAAAAILSAADDALRKTRGAAMAVATIGPAARHLAFAGIGNINAVIVTPKGRHNLMSHAGIVGAGSRQVRELKYEWPGAPALLVLHSDGLSARWNLLDYPGLFAREPALIAGLLYRDLARRRDDATVVVVKDTGHGTTD